MNTQQVRRAEAMSTKPLRPFLVTLVIAALVITGLTAIARAQSAPEAVSATAAQTGSGFTFQGQLQDGGNPVNAACDIQAGLWDAETNGEQVGSTQTVSDVAVANGRFTITLNANSEFGESAFTGQARWLQIAVRCPAGSGNYATLQPRQPLTAAPYAHGLVPGARMQSDDVGLWGLQIAMSSDQAHGAIYTQMGDVINSGIQAGIRSDSTFPDVYPIVAQTNQTFNPAIWGRNTAGGSGVTATSVSGNGLFGHSDSGNGVIASTDLGVALRAEDGFFGSLAGVFSGDVTITGVCTGCTQAAFGVNNGQTTLQQGDLVTIEGVSPAAYGNAPQLWQVRQAQAGDPIVGVVHSAIQARPDQETGQEILMPGANNIAPGDLLSIIIFGPAPVRMDATAGDLQAGMRVAAAANGRARSLQTVEVNGVTLNEAAPTLGIALEAGDTDGDGLVWVLVSPN